MCSSDFRVCVGGSDLCACAKYVSAAKRYFARGGVRKCRGESVNSNVSQKPSLFCPWAEISRANGHFATDTLSVSEKTPRIAETGDGPDEGRANVGGTDSTESVLFTNARMETI